MWDLIVTVPDHCLSFYFIIELLQTKCSYFRFNLQIVKKYNTCYVSFSSVCVSVSKLFRFNEIGCNK